MKDGDERPIRFALGDMDKPRRVNEEVVLTTEQMITLSNGVMAHGQDDRWIVFCRGSEYFIHRSWTGQRIYQLEFSNMDVQGVQTSTYRSRYFFVEGNTEIYQAPKSDYEIKNELQKLLDVFTSQK